jgi:hypothetical protein
VLAAKQEPATETYMVSTKVQKILALAEDALKEGKELALSKWVLISYSNFMID